jgi:hypothetical protein
MPPRDTRSGIKPEFCILISFALASPSSGCSLKLTRIDGLKKIKAESWDDKEDEPHFCISI